MYFNVYKCQECKQACQLTTITGLPGHAYSCPLDGDRVKWILIDRFEVKE